VRLIIRHSLDYFSIRNFIITLYHSPCYRYCDKQIQSLSARMQSGEAQDVEEVAKVIHVDYTVNVIRTAVFYSLR
jgi:hypothetical protein